MPVEKRVLAAEAFWRDGSSTEVDVQHLEAVAALAKRLNFRARSIQALPIERRARHLAQWADPGDTIASRALIAYHFSHQRPLMSAFLDAIGVAHDNGLISEEEMRPPDRERLASAVAAIKSSFDPADIDLYLRTLAALDGDTWAGIDAVVKS